MRSAANWRNSGLAGKPGRLAMLMPGGQSTRDGPLRAHRRPVFPGPRPRQVCSPGAGHAGPPEASEESVPGPWRSQNPSLPAVNVHIGALRRAKGGYAGDPTSSRRCQRARLATRLRRLLAGAHAHKARRHQCAHRLHRHLHRAHLDVRRSIVLYDESATFAYATDELPSDNQLQALYESSGVRYWSRGC